MGAGGGGYIVYCKRRYFRAAKFSRVKPSEAFSRYQIFTQKAVGSLCAILIYFFTHIVFFTHLRPGAKCAKICTAQKILSLQYVAQVGSTMLNVCVVSWVIITMLSIILMIPYYFISIYQ